MDVFQAPNLTERPLSLTAERTMALSPGTLYRAWTERFDEWFAKPGSVLMRPEVDVPFFFVTEFDGTTHPHYGRFLRLEPDRLVELTWVTGAGGTDGAETVVTIELESVDERRTRVRLTHAGFLGETAREGHRQAWPIVLEEMERQLAGA